MAAERRKLQKSRGNNVFDAPHIHIYSTQWSEAYHETHDRDSLKIESFNKITSLTRFIAIHCACRILTRFIWWATFWATQYILDDAVFCASVPEIRRRNAGPNLITFTGGQSELTTYGSHKSTIGGPNPLLLRRWLSPSSPHIDGWCLFDHRAGRNATSRGPVS